MIRALQTVFPEHNWKPMYYGDQDESFWSDLSNQQNFFDFVAKELNISRPEDWYNVK